MTTLSPQTPIPRRPEVSPSPLQVGSCIGRGRVGTVYAGQLAGRPVAVKQVPNEHVEALERDWTVLRSVDHPHVVPALHFARVPAGAQLVLGRADASFETVVPDTRTLLRLVEQVASALDALHAAGWVHRDVKPGNLLLHGRDVWVSDCGLAHPVGSTTPAAPVGSLPYMAPEAFLWQTGPASDWFSLGVTLYELLTGALPFEEDTLQGEILAKQAGRHRPLPRLRIPWQNLVDGLLDPDPTMRWDGDVVREWLESVCNPVSASA